MNNSTEASTILLMCLGTEQTHEQTKTLSVKTLRQFFIPFGPLCKIIIFSKRVQLKAFIEFSDLQDAMEAKTFMHNTELNSFGNLKLYFSARQTLEFSNQFLEYKEYSPAKRNSARTSVRLSARDSINVADFFSLVEDSEPDRKILSEKRNFCNTKKKSDASQFKRASELEKPKDKKNQIFPPVHISERIDSRQKKTPFILPSSNVILISNLEECFFTATELFNVFSCFGNIVKILLMKNLHKAMIEFVTQESAEKALEEMNLRWFGSSVLKINFSKYKSIDLKKNNKSENSQQFNEAMVISQNMQRYDHQEKIDPINVSDTLLLAVEKTAEFSSVGFFLHIQEIANVVSAREIPNKAENQDSGVQKILFKFKKISESVKALALCHNSQYQGGLISAIFSKNGISQKQLK